VHVAIVGARHVDHIEDSLRAVDISLTDSDLDEIETIMDDATPVAGPSPEGMP
jgi:aryl-alcohol dehydrogenase-like predicted oxidoreductase